MVGSTVPECIDLVDLASDLIHYRLEEIFTEAEYNAQWNVRGRMADVDLESVASFEAATTSVMSLMAPNLIERVDMKLVEDNPDEERMLFGSRAVSENSSIVEHQGDDNHGSDERHSDQDHALIVAAFERVASDRLDDPHVVVLDSGASASSSPHLQGVIRTRQ